MPDPKLITPIIGGMVHIPVKKLLIPQRDATLASRRGAEGTERIRLASQRIKLASRRGAEGSQRIRLA